jgi:hypothetical protein
MASGVITPGEVAERSAEMIEIRCGRCDRAGPLVGSAAAREHGPDAAIGAMLHALAGDCPNKDSGQIQHRCDSYCPDLVRRGGAPIEYYDPLIFHQQAGGWRLLAPMAKVRFAAAAAPARRA